MSTKLAKTSEVVFTGHTKAIHAIGWNNDGKRLATASGDTTARVWNIETHREGRETELKDHTEPVDGLSWCPNHSEILATASQDKMVRLWDLRARRSLAIPTPDEILNVEYSPDGNFLLTNDKSESVRLIDVRNSKNSIVASNSFDQQYWVNEIAWTANGDGVLVVAGRQATSFQEKGVLELLSVKAGDGGAELKSVHAITAHTANCLTIAMDPHNKHFATGAYDSSCCIWDAQELCCLRQCCTNLEEGVGNLGFSCDGAFVGGVGEVERGSTARKLIDICTVSNGETVLKIDTKATARRLAWHPRQYMLAYGGEKMTDESYRDRGSKSEVPLTVVTLQAK